MVRIICLTISIILTIIFPINSFAKSPPYFEGELSLGPNGCKQTDKCKVNKDFGYVDKNNLGWKVNEGFVTNGASIPRWAQWFAGEPWEPSYLQAAVIHDWYSKSERPVYGWLQTQRMFREVLLQSGVSLGKANLLYAGVLIGSGKWIYKLEGNKCKFSDPNVFCLQQVGQFKIQREKSIWGTKAFKSKFLKFKNNSSALASASVEDIEAMAAKELENPVYILEDDGVIESSNGNFNNLLTK